MAFDRMFNFVSIAAILVLAVRPKHPPLWKTKFAGLMASRFTASDPV
jgi:hypothetical protein